LIKIIIIIIIIIIITFGLHVSSSLLLSAFNGGTGIFLTDFRKILRHQISLKSIQWVASCYMWTDRRVGGQTGMTNQIVAFSQVHERA